MCVNPNCCLCSQQPSGIQSMPHLFSTLRQVRRQSSRQPLKSWNIRCIVQLFSSLERSWTMRVSAYSLCKELGRRLYGECVCSSPNCYFHSQQLPIQGPLPSVFRFRQDKNWFVKRPPEKSERWIYYPVLSHSPPSREKLGAGVFLLIVQCCVMGSDSGKRGASNFSSSSDAASFTLTHCVRDSQLFYEFLTRGIGL